METKQITKAIIKVMQSVKGMEKNSKVGKGIYQYDGTKDQDVKMVFNEALASNGLCIVPTDIHDETDVKRWTDSSGKPKQSVFTKVKVRYLLMHESGESIQLMGYGHGVDSQDKGAGKATTYALKNCLLYTFLTPVGNMPDTDLTHSEDIETPTEQKTSKKTVNSKGLNKAIARIAAGEKDVPHKMSESFELTDTQAHDLVDAQIEYDDNNRITTE